MTFTIAKDRLVALVNEQLTREAELRAQGALIFRTKEQRAAMRQLDRRMPRRDDRDPSI